MSRAEPSGIGLVTPDERRRPTDRGPVGRRQLARRAPRRPRRRPRSPRTRRAARASRRAAAGGRPRPGRRRWRRASAGRIPRRRARTPWNRRIQPSNASSTSSRVANTSGWSQSALSSTPTIGRYGSKLPAYSSASTTVGLPSPSRTTDGSAPVSSVGRTAPTNADGSSPARTRRWTSQPVVVDLPCVPATARRSPPRVAIASAMSCWQLTAGMPAAWAAWSSGWSGSTEVSAFDTAIRSTTARPAASTT